MNPINRLLIVPSTQIMDPSFARCGTVTEAFLMVPINRAQQFDQALVNIIQFYTKNTDQIERIWLSSPQGQREKTRVRKDYREKTIARAFDRELPEIIFEGIENVVFTADRISTATLEARATS